MSQQSTNDDDSIKEKANNIHSKYIKCSYRCLKIVFMFNLNLLLIMFFCYNILKKSIGKRPACALAGSGGFSVIRDFKLRSPKFFSPEKTPKPPGFFSASFG